MTELDVGYSVRSSQDYDATRRDLLDRLIPVTMPSRAEERARELQRDLVARGQHRGVSVTGQPTEWVVPPGSID